MVFFRRRRRVEVRRWCCGAANCETSWYRVSSDLERTRPWPWTGSWRSSRWTCSGREINCWSVLWCNCCCSW